MDFIRLAVRDGRRNAARTLLAVIAVALATAAPVLARVIPEGYPTEFRLPERQYLGGDLVVWPAIAPIDTRGDSLLSWRAWDGSDWQSHALYFLPSLPHSGYLAEIGTRAWGPVEAASVAGTLQGVNGVAKVSPYLVLPCVVQTLDGPVQAVLRGRGPEPADSPLSMAHLVTTGRPLSTEDRGTPAALVPLQGGFSDGAFSLVRDFEVAVAGRTLSLRPVGGYQVVVGEEEDRTQAPGPSGRYPVIPVFWERTEIVVTEETFREVAGQAEPVYQLSISAGRISTLKATVDAVRKALGPGFAVYSVPELVALRNSSIATPVIAANLRPVFLGLTSGLAGVIVTGSVYILLSQQRRKIGLLRVVGATRRDIVVYALGVAVYVTLVGDAVGFLTGKLLSLVAVLSSDMTASEWLRLAASDLLTGLGLSLSITAVLGLSVGLWASRIPCAEVLRRE